MISSKIGHSLDPLLLRICRTLFGNRTVNPNAVTVLGFIFGCAASFCIGFGTLLIGGIMLFISGFLDTVDGALARNTNSVTLFGGFLDSVLDRYTDLLVIFGIFVYFLRHGDVRSVVITCIASIGIAIIPYAKARAEAASLDCDTGLLERPERVILLLIGLFLNILQYVIIVLAVFTHITVIQRIVFVKRNS